jgi:hypothetical protein
MQHRRSVVAALVLAVSLTGVCLAEDLDVNVLFDGAKKAHAEKRYGRCLADLRLLVGEVGRARIAQLRTVLPAAPAGWEAEEVSDDGSAAYAMFSIGLNVQRQFTKGESRVKVDLVADSPFVASVSMLLGNPAFLPANTKIVTVKGRKALLEHEVEAKRAVLRLLFNENTTMLSVEGDGVSTADVSETFANALDLDAIDKALRE